MSTPLLSPRRDPPADAAPERWFEEVGTWAEKHSFRVNAVLYEGRTRYQSVAIYDTEEYDTMLVIDGHTQSAEFDEYIYHECLVQPAMTLHPSPKRVLVIGGGEGATIREVLRHPTVERVVMVDIDAELVEICKRYLPEWHRGAFSDPRVELVHGDGLAYVRDSRESFDVILVDVCDDDLDTSPAHSLYADDFYRALEARLEVGGILVVQALELAVGELDGHAAVRAKLKSIFRDVQSYACFIPSFWCDWGFLIAGNSLDPVRMTPEAIDRTLDERDVSRGLRYYDGLTHRRIASLPKDLRRGIDRPSS